MKFLLPTVWRPIVLCAAGLLLLSTARADWVQCSECSPTLARQLALQLPPDRFGITTVNVLDTAQRSISAFRVHVFYDYEFRSYLRFAQPAAIADAAQRDFEAWLSIRESIDALQAASIDVAIDSVARFLSQPGSDVLIDNALQLTGLSGAFSAAGSLAPFAIQFGDRVPVRFSDGSTAMIALTRHPVTAALDWSYVPGSPAGPNGGPLPDSTQALAQLDQMGDERTTRYLTQHIYNVWQFHVFVREFLDAARRYRVTCDGADPSDISCRAVQVG